MRLKRVYHQDRLERDESGKVTKVHPNAVKGVQILRTANTIQHFTEDFVAGGIKEGWLSMGQGKLTITPVDGDPAVYQIVRVPGYYCCFDDEPLPDANVRRGEKTLGQIHVEEKHRGQASPDPSNPLGYRKDNYYTCVLLSGVQENLSPEDAEKLEREIREELHRKVAPKVNRAQEAAREKKSASSSGGEGEESPPRSVPPKTGRRN